MKKKLQDIKELLTEEEELNRVDNKEPGRMTTAEIVKTAAEIYFKILEEKCPVKSRYYH